eukprot:gene38397-65491_t
MSFPRRRLTMSFPRRRLTMSFPRRRLTMSFPRRRLTMSGQGAAAGRAARALHGIRRSVPGRIHRCTAAPSPARDGVLRVGRRAPRSGTSGPVLSHTGARGKGRCALGNAAHCGEQRVTYRLRVSGASAWIGFAPMVPCLPDGAWGELDVGTNMGAVGGCKG